MYSKLEKICNENNYDIKNNLYVEFLNRLTNK